MNDTLDIAEALRRGPVKDEAGLCGDELRGRYHKGVEYLPVKCERPVGHAGHHMVCGVREMAGRRYLIVWY